MTDEELETFILSRPVMRKMPTEFVVWYKDEPMLAQQLGLERHREINMEQREGSRVNVKPAPYRSRHPDVAADRDAYEMWKAANPELAAAWKYFAHRAYICRMRYERMRERSPDQFARLASPSYKRSSPRRRLMHDEETAVFYPWGGGDPIEGPASSNFMA